MHNFNHKKILRILAMLMVFVMALSCFAACGKDDSDSDEDDDSKGGSGKMVSYSWKGLNYELSDEYEDKSVEGYAFYRTKSWSLCVADATTPAGVTDSQSYANHFKTTDGSNFASLSVNSKDGLYYTVGDYGDGTTEVRGFYVNGNHCWVMYISCYSEDYSDSFVSVVTGGTIDNNYQYTPDNDNTQQPGTPDPKPPVDQPDPKPPVDQPDPKPPVDQPDPKPALKEYSFDGLSYQIGDDYNATVAEDSVTHSNGSTAIIVVSGWAPDNVTNSSTFADFFVNEASSSGYSCQKKTANGISYTVTDWNDGTMEVRGFYIYNDYGWSIYATTTNYANESDLLVEYVTSGVVDKNFDHGTNDENNSGNSGNTNPDPNPGPVDPPDDGMINVYTLVPDSWGVPGCWAWLNAPLTNAFDAWPGETMKWTGKYYTTTAPDWVDYVIINGSNGEIKTEDIAIEAGKDVWVIIHADGQWYTLLYTEPTAAELAGMGY